MLSPLRISILFFVLGVTLAWYSASWVLLTLLLLCSLLCLSLWIIYNDKKWALLILALGAFTGGFSDVKIHEAFERQKTLPFGRQLCLKVLVVESPKEESFANHKLVAQSPQFGRLQIKLKASSSLPALGDEIYVYGSLQKPSEGNQRFSEKLYFKAQSLAGKLSKAEVLKIEQANSLQGRALRMVGNLQASLTSIHKTELKNDESSLVQAMLIGRTAGMPLSKQLRLQGQNLGVAHIYAASALNLTALILFMGFILGLFKVPTKARFAALIALAIFYTFLSGWVPSMVRACFIAVVALCGKLIKREISLLNTLLLGAFLALAINPNQIGDLGFQFSYLATLGIVLWTDKLVHKIKFVPRSWAEPFAVTLTAESLLLPLQLYYFHNLPVYSLLANLLAVPLASLILLLALLASLFSLIGSLGWLIASVIEFVVSLSVKLLVTWLNFLSSLPGSNLSLQNVPLAWVLWLALLVIMLGFFWKFRLAKHLIMASATGLVFWSLCCQPANLTLQSISKRWYEAVVLITPNHKRIVICNQVASKGSPNALEKDLQAFHVHKIDYWIGNCKPPERNLVLRTFNPKEKTELQVSKELRLKVSPKAVLIDYKNFSGLILFEPMSLSDKSQFYSLVKYSYLSNAGRKIPWSDSPKTEYCLTPHLSKLQRTTAKELLSNTCTESKDYMEMKNKKIITDGLTLKFED